MSRPTILAADLFCGAGGTSQGLLMAANRLNADLELIAINHWQVAIDTHALNHPLSKHLCTGLDAVRPLDVVPGGRLKVLCASPECTHHSNARGGKPMNDQSRASAWCVLRWANDLYIENIIIENVPEFKSWGPLGANGRPLKSKKGELFAQFIASLKALGYNVEHRVLNCADYGDPTSRERLFVIARRNNRPIRWPEPTHIAPSKSISKVLFAEHRPAWRTAREIIDWSLPSRSIFGRKKPLKDTTLLRIEAGLRKFCGLNVDLRRCMAEDLRPFIVVLRNNGDAQSLDQPLRTVAASGQHFGLVEPFVVPQFSSSDPRSVDRPLGTVTTTSRGVGLTEAFLLPHRNKDGNVSVDEPFHTVTAQSSDWAMAQAFLIGQQSGATPRSAGEPAPTVATAGAISLTTPYLLNIDHGSGNGTVRSADAPLSTVTTKERSAVVSPYLVTVNHGDGDATRRTKSVDEPLGTVTGSRGTGVAEPFVVPYFGERDGQTPRTHSVDDPVSTVTGQGAGALVQPFLVAYYGNIQTSDVDDPLQTQATKDRFALVTPEVGDTFMLDIHFRMLQPDELARAQGFPASYKFTGKREDVVKQIGNAVPPGTASELAMAVLA